MKLLPKLVALACTVLLPCLSFADLKHSDLAGDYISYSSSAGGNTTIDPTSAGITTVTQFRLFKDGTGIVNFLNAKAFFSTTLQPTVNYTNLPATYTIDNASIGVGTLVIENYPVPGVNLNTTYVASKSARRTKKRCGSVDQIYINANSNSSALVPLRDASVIIARRQFL
jgi:hypothetical protein